MSCMQVKYLYPDLVLRRLFQARRASSKNEIDRMASLLLKNGYIITVNRNRDVIRNGWIWIDGDSIREIGSMESLPSGPDANVDESIDLKGMIVIPGLINGHNHHWASLFKNTGEGLLLEPWLDQV